MPDAQAEEEDWKEYRIHCDSNDKEAEVDDEEEYIRYVSHNLFDSQEVDSEGESEYYEVHQYTIETHPSGRYLICHDAQGTRMPLPSTTQDGQEEEVIELETSPSCSLTVSIRHHVETANSTGLGVWTGAELLAQYLLQQDLKEKHVVELGAGVGLCGLIAQQMGAARVTLTDGDSVVLRNLRYNVQQNKHMEGVMDCKQLIWGEKHARKFVQEYPGNLPPQKKNQIQVVMASDCLYMVQSVVPFWETVATLLAPTVPAGTDGEEETTAVEDKRMIYVHGPASQAPLEMVLQTAKDKGLECIAEQVHPRLFVFRPKARRRQGDAKEE